MRTLFVAAFTWPMFLSAACNSQAQAEPTPRAADIEPAAPQAVPPEAPAEPPAAAKRTYYVAADSLDVFAAPRRGATARGRIDADTPFEVLAKVEGPDCPGGWAKLPSYGFACLEGTTTTTDAAVAQPELVTYDAPLPVEFAHYIETGEYDHGEPETLVPSVYAKRWRRFKGNLYASLDAWNAEEKPVGRLLGGAGNKYHFTEIVETERGPVLVREDGQVAALDDVYLYPVSRLQGHDLIAQPLGDGLLPAFAIDYEGAPVQAEPNEESEVHHRIDYHEPLVVRAEPVGGRWWAVPNALGPGKDGYVNDWRSIRHAVSPPSRPAGVEDNELWIDVELDQQVMQLFKGDELVWFTLVSTGAAPMGTPKGIYEITDKMATKTMASRPDSDDPYMVEDVPWTIHFKPSYAIHGAYWHWGFGRTASHGCINMAPKDVQFLWSRIGPEIPDGWHTSWRTDATPGSVLQVRRGNLPIPDKRQVVAEQ